MTRPIFKLLGVSCLICTPLVFLFPVNVFAYCYEPSMYEAPPEPPRSFNKPSVPYCLDGYSYSGKHTCDQWEVDAYIDDVNDYIRQLNNYVEEANSFANSAARFASEAADYARCEADDAKSEIE